MTTEFRNLRAAMGSAPSAGKPPHWSELMRELLPAISSPLTWEAEGFLLAVLRFEGRLGLTVSSDLPHSMPPEDMLKSLAIQALGKWTGLAYLQEMQRVQATTQSSSLSSLVRDVIQKTREETKPRETKEEIAVSSPEQAKKTVPRRLGKDRGMSYIGGSHFGTGQKEPEPAYC